MKWLTGPHGEGDYLIAFTNTIQGRDYVSPVTLKEVEGELRIFEPQDDYQYKYFGPHIVIVAWMKFPRFPRHRKALQARQAPLGSQE